ncbi:MAG: hypothetical protein WC824_07710 [Bacteroidota bacterium]|jgi:hypothetical protein
MTEKQFLLCEDTEKGMVEGICIGIDALVESIRKRQSDSSEPNEIGVWAQAAGVGDVCRWTCGSIARVSGDPYLTATVRGMSPAQMVAWVQKWEETERGWGIRPDGFSIHATKEGSLARLDNMRDREAKMGYGSNNVPDEYTRRCGDPYKTLLTDAELIKKVMADPLGVWVQKMPPRIQE